MSQRVQPGRSIAVKNKAPASVQITAEQILREAMERVAAEPKAPKTKITDPEELEDYRLERRKGFEDNIRRQRTNIGAWTKYALWEASQMEFDRARSIFERALEVDYRNQTLWLKYAELEMKNKFINSARNIWDRAVTLLPRVDQFWYKYAYMEEMLGNVNGARQIFERWMQWQPDYSAWNSYVKLEERHQKYDRCRQVFERWLVCHPEVRTYKRYAKWEERQGEISRARTIYERAMVELGDEANSEALFVDFAQFEERHKEFDRARVIYKYALDHLPKKKAEEVFEMYTSFEKQHGTREGLEQVILSKRRFQYEEEIKANPHNYDVWFDYIRLEEAIGEVSRVREVYERAIANVPPAQEKRFWKRYIYLWINFALFEELIAKDVERARAVYNECLKLVPHKQFTFSKIWLMFAEFEVRRRDVTAARKILGTAIGKCPKEKLFKGYIALELQLAEMDRCRTLYQRYLEHMPDNCSAWVKYAQLETSLAEHERARGIFELAVNQDILDTPEILWKAYIDFELQLGQHDRVRSLYGRLLKRTKHVKVWISFAQFEAGVSNYKGAREVFEKAEEYLKSEQAKEERVMLLEGWVDFERNFGTPETLEKVQKKLPRRIKKKRLLKTDDGDEAGWEEYFDYIFPDEVSKTNTLAILERARAWKRQKSSD